MARLHIYVAEIEGQDGNMKTVSKFGKTVDWNKVVFHNSHRDKNLEIKIDQPGALCKSNNVAEGFPVTIEPGRAKRYTICEDYNGKEFKYTATLDSADPEDPIIIIERINLADFYGIAVLLVGAASLAFVAGTLFGSRRARRKMGTAA